ncbi:MAG: histidine kinase [Pseudomonadota bacterium]
MRQPKAIGIQALLLRTFLPAVLVVAMALAVLVYNLQYAVIMDGFDRKLVTTSVITGAMIHPDDHDLLMREAQSDKNPMEVEGTEHYVRNIEPMQRIREKLGLTYLYTQALGGDADIYYILDSSFGDDHSPIGSEDELPAETVAGLRSAQTQGGVYISPVEYQKQWGLLKTAAAPVYGAYGAITATAGADVDISVIQVATQNALFASAVIGIISTLACLFVTLQIVQRIARPIETLRQEALRIAAGDHSPPAKIKRPREAAALRDALAALTIRMMHRSADILDASRTWRHDADAKRLIDALRSNASIVMLCDNEKFLIIWTPTDPNSIEGALAARSMTLLRDRLNNSPELIENWKTLADLEQGVCLCFDRQAKSVRAYGGPATIRIDEKSISLNGGEAIDLSTASSAVAFMNGNEATILESMTA